MSTFQGRILVVDDNPFNSDVLSRLLEHKGYGVSIVSNGHHALDMVEKGGIDLVLLDIMMPGVSGMEVLRQMRQRHPNIDLPIIMLTAMAESEAVLAAFEAGADDYITRPIELPLAMARIEAQLRLREQARSQVGELHKIGGSVRSRPRSSPFYCPVCVSCHTSYVTQCSICGAARPQGGWPKIESSTCSHLGQTVGGRYFLEQFIGRGSVGQVYRARDIDLGRDFAIKIIAASDKEGLRHQTLREVGAQVRMENPYVVKIYQVLMLEDDVCALVMDFVRGFSLEQVLDAHGPLPPWLALDVARQVALALHGAHALGILHRDVKPGNIMLEQMPTQDYFVRLLDFGIVQIMGRPSGEHGLCGTPAYMSPEQIVGEQPLDARSDIYALGAVLYHTLVGRAPFEEQIKSAESEGVHRAPSSSVMLQLQHQLFTTLPPLSKMLPRIKGLDDVDALLQKMMAKDPEERHQDISEVLEEMVVLLDQF
ncbi:MAG: response regulator [Myxococcota bacterium]